jgi:hypothetical protein
MNGSVTYEDATFPGMRRVATATSLAAVLFTVLAAIPAVRNAAKELEIMWSPVADWRPWVLVVPLALAVVSFSLGSKQRRTWTIALPSAVLVIVWGWMLFLNMASTVVF